MEAETAWAPLDSGIVGSFKLEVTHAAFVHLNKTGFMVDLPVFFPGQRG